MEASVPGTSSTMGSYRTRSGKHRRDRCVTCGQTFSSTKGMPYDRLQHRRARFDAVVALRVEGVSLCPRLLGLRGSPGTPSRDGWNMQPAGRIRCRGAPGGKTRPTWIVVAIEVWSRLWPSTVTDRRSYRHTLALLRDVANRMECTRLPLIGTDGFEFSEKVVRRVFGPAVLYGQVLKTRRHDRIVEVERRARMGAAWRFEAALTNSEDSSTLNTSFIERMNLTIRQGSAYLSRRTLAHARSKEKLEQHLELRRCHYNFVRPHGALKFGR